MDRKYLFSLLEVLIAIVIWSASFVATKFAYEAFTPLVVCFIRFSLAALILYVLHRRRGNQPLAKEDRRAVILTGLSGITIYYSFENIGLSLTSAANASVITAIYPIMTILFGAVVYHDQIPLRQLGGILVGVAGILVVTYTGGDTAGSSTLGNILLLFNGFMWGLYNYQVKKVSNHTGALTLTYYQTLYGVLFLIPFLGFELPLSIGPITPRVIGAILFLTAGCSVGAYALYNHGLRKVSAASAVSIMNLMPVFGLLFSHILLGETITMRQVIGAAAVIAGVMLSEAVKKS